MQQSLHLCVLLILPALLVTGCGAPSIAVAPTSTPSPQPTMTETSTVTPTNTSTPTETPLPTSTPLPTATNTPTLTATPEPTALPPTSTPTLNPTPAPTTTPTIVRQLSTEEQIKTIVEQATAGEKGQADTYIYDLGQQKGVEVTFTFSDNSRIAVAKRQVAFNIHRALWTSALPIGSVTAIIYAPNSPAPKANAKAGYVLMEKYQWDQADPDSWAAYLEANRVIGGSEQEVTWYNERP